ncbi:MAG: hypothetical protein QOH21_3587 [Acidobacteriota bacterium]|jgi:hypothetical protein|nr:hypothetical protein [Acidobacteriota bacterium]
MPTATDTEEDLSTQEAARSRRSIGEDPVPAPSHSSRNVPSDFRQVNGWGADLDPANRPSYPKELPSDVMTVRGDVRAWQVPQDRVHLSNEHPNLTPVFGESVPPHGLSGLLRDYAFQFGEATNRHWMTLLLADRVDVFESLIGGLATGRPDRYIKEKGWGAKLKYADTNTLHRKKYVLVAGAVLGAIALGLVLNRAMAED